MKSIIEPLIALLFLIFFLPLLLVIAFCIKIDSPGSIFIKNHTRIGKNNQYFRMFKFRTMYDKSEDIFMPESHKINMFKTINDKRVTNFGKFLRKTDLDELPQLINIILGQMSFVGPRGFMPEEEDFYKKKWPNLKPQIEFRKSVKPGLTGLWQVKARYTGDLKDRLAFDKLYIDQVSLTMDLQIILATFSKLITQKWQ